MQKQWLEFSSFPGTVPRPAPAPAGWKSLPHLPGPESCPRAVSSGVWVHISFNNRLSSQLRWWEELLTESSCPLSPHLPLAPSGDEQIPTPELGLPLERVMCHLAPVLPRRRGLWRTGGAKKEALSPPWQRPSTHPVGSRLPFSPAGPAAAAFLA